MVSTVSSGTPAQFLLISLNRRCSIGLNFLCAAAYNKLMSRKHLHRYVNEFTGRYNSRGKSLPERMAELVSGMVGQGLSYKQLVA